MNKPITFLIIGILIGMLFSFIGIFTHNYELEKCQRVSSTTNQNYYNYELQDNCYMALNKTNLNLFLNCFAFGLLFVILFGLIGLLIGIIYEDY